MAATSTNAPRAPIASGDGRITPLARAFASTSALSREELMSAPVHWPRPSRLQAALEVPVRRMASGLSALGLATVGDLLEHLPSDSREARTVSTLRAGEPATVAVTVRRIASRAVRRRGMRPLVEATVFDSTGTMRATFFNQPWLVERYPAATRLLLHGRPDNRGGFAVSHHSPASAAGQEQDAPAPAGEGDSVAHYPASEGVSSTEILNLVRAAAGMLRDVPEALSAATRVGEGLPDRPSALAAMHFPRSPADLEQGRRRLAFEEMLLTQLLFLRRRARRAQRTGAHVLADQPSLTERWLSEILPFSPTGDQLEAMRAIGGDMERASPMHRLLMGEVGSGKTVVALYAMLRAVEHGAQAALMAPTETLAEQHFANVQMLLGAEPATVALLTGSTPAARRRETLARLASGELSMIVGTHALIEPDVVFRSLAVAVIDEQHRFGVRQRAALDEKGTPHVLHMTATPIPRTLALARYADLDTSTLRELPAGRRPIRTRLLSGESERSEAYEQVREHLAAGRQAYVVCPLIDDAGGEDAAEGGQEGLRAATAELERLREGELRGFTLALLHGGMRPREKQGAMAAFASGAADVLVATTVIEVGIDVPNATVMLIENAERFGISQLHQLRGRIGRGEHSSVCFLVGPAGASSMRLRAVAQHTDGFRLAEIDLSLRSEGELAGTRQSGVAQFTVACLPDDAPLLELARARAQLILAEDPELQGAENALLADELHSAFGEEATLPIPG
jgi:ATP-dependent DNA helicase RecG